MTPAKSKGNIEFPHFPMLGRNTDTSGKEWDVGAVVNNSVSAVPVHELHPYYTDTSGAGFGLVSQTWNAYMYTIKRD